MPLQFYQRDALTARSGYDAKWHVPHWIEPDEVACRTKGIRLCDLRPMGPDPPADINRVCARCLKSRPDLTAILERSRAA